MTLQEWTEFAGRLRQRAAELTAEANATSDPQIADRLFGSAKEYEDAAENADKDAAACTE